MKTYTILTATALLLAASSLLKAADHLKLNPDLNFMRNSFQGPLIIGAPMDDGVAEGVPNYIFFYAEYCFNAKRQALRTVELYKDYKGLVHFVIVDVSRPLPPEHKDLVEKYFDGKFPHITILDKTGKVVFNYTGEASAATLIGWLDSTLWSTFASPEQHADNSRPPPDASAKSGKP